MALRACSSAAKVPPSQAAAEAVCDRCRERNHYTCCRVVEGGRCQCPRTGHQRKDELGEYLKLPQIENTGEWCGIKWWAANKT